MIEVMAPSGLFCADNDKLVVYRTGYALGCHYVPYGWL